MRMKDRSTLNKLEMYLLSLVGWGPGQETVVNATGA
jgi:hypothetical protein